MSLKNQLSQMKTSQNKEKAKAGGLAIFQPEGAEAPCIVVIESNGKVTLDVGSFTYEEAYEALRQLLDQMTETEGGSDGADRAREEGYN